MLRSFTGLVMSGALMALGVSALAVETVPADRLAAWTRAASELQEKVTALPDDATSRRDDAAVCAKAVEWIVRHKEFHKPNYLEMTDQVLALGQRRLEELAQGASPWVGRPGMTTVFGYTSNLDGSVQPFAVTLPKSFDAASRRRWPLHLVLHGRGDTLNEVSFVRQHDGKVLKDEIGWIQLDVFGRTNNAYRWAGEVDVFEALGATRRLFPVDEQRVTLWGFSMGGAGAWHLGLHYPDKWSSVGAGAGFSDTVKYLNLKEPLSPLHHRLVRIYDGVEYTLNAANIPIIGYGGELDKQLLAAQTMHDRAAELGVSIPVLVGPQTEHKFHPDSLKEFMAFHATATEKGRPAFPGLKKIRFTTCTPKYNTCEWVTVEEQLTPYEHSDVDAEIADTESLVRVTTKNVGVLSLSRDVADFVSIDGGERLPLLSAAGGLLPNVYFERTSEGWKGFDYRASHEYLTKPGTSKRRHLQGPIDDAFTRSFVCVRGTGTPWSADHADWANWTLDRFGREYDKYLRGKLPIVNDTQLSDEQLETHNLILFGDPGSNAVLARVVDRLPIQWTKEALEVRGKTYPTAEHGVPLIFPNPLNPHRYVVINSGHTFHEPEFKGSNAQLYPRLGDIGVLKFERQPSGDFAETTLWSDIFTVQWGFPVDTTASRERQ
ncbi:MAG: alpha/beta hydrolase-fold protein [Planctomycetaceae bacterium]|nr:alpha/beta hydrolase-fold protein [Planctomycetaceae bacterium]